MPREIYEYVTIAAMGVIIAWENRFAYLFVGYGSNVNVEIGIVLTDFRFQLISYIS